MVLSHLEYIRQMAVSRCRRSAREEKLFDFGPFLYFLVCWFSLLTQLSNVQSFIVPYPHHQHALSCSFKDDGSWQWRSSSLQYSTVLEEAVSNRRNQAVSLTKVTTSNSSIPMSLMQEECINCEAPAVLLNSGPGTGKTHVLAGRIRHLLLEKKEQPSNMVILSFSNRDASQLKRKALDMLYKENSEFRGMSRSQLDDQLWAGTIHAFAFQIINTIVDRKQSRGKRLRQLNAQERRMRMDKSLKELMDPSRSKLSKDALSRLRSLHLEAFKDTRQSRGVLLQGMSRCLEIWKESGLIRPPASNLFDIDTTVMVVPNVTERLEASLEVAYRLGVTTNVARLAWEAAKFYQRLHTKHATCDPADVALLAYCALLNDPQRLTSIRSKLHHVILDEYQDVSVGQHSLIRLLISGVFTAKNSNVDGGTKIPPVLVKRESSSEQGQIPPSFKVPSLFASGDSHQSIYGWRGASPTLTVDGFHHDFPQGVVVELDTSFRFQDDLQQAVNLLKDKDLAYQQTAKESSLMSIMLSHDNLMTATVSIKSLWDAREEAKLIARMIRKRARQRVRDLERSVGGIDGRATTSLADFSEVAILVRSESAISLLKEYLIKANIPHTLFGKEKSVKTFKPQDPCTRMKEVSIMSMHRAKGEEFDEVYLPGWTEGIFPIPTAVSVNRVEEERRLAFVALSRARRRAMITYSNFRVALHGLENNPSANKNVTVAAEPSRFLFELVPQAKESSKPTVTNSHIFSSHSLSEKIPAVVWDRRQGSKRVMVGSDVPEHFSKAHQRPKGFKDLHQLNAAKWQESKDKRQELLSPILPSDDFNDAPKLPQPIQRIDEAPQDSKLVAPVVDKVQSPMTSRSGDTEDSVSINSTLVMKETLDRLDDIISKGRPKGPAKGFFKQLLKESFGIVRGKGIIFPFDEDAWKARPSDWRSFPQQSLPLSRMTAFQLGVYVLYLCSKEH